VLTLPIGKDYTLIATVTPDSATNKTVTWTSSDNTKVIVTNGRVRAIAKGMETITVKAGNETAFCVITVLDPITTDSGIFINGVKWATRNVDTPGTFAFEPEDAGMFYQWNRNKAWSVTGDVTYWDATESESDTWAKANDPSPAGWRLPTEADVKKLLDTERVTNIWVTQNGVNGRRFIDKDTGKSLFLPAAGYRIGSDGMLYSAGSDGYYWSSTRIDRDGAWNLYFNGSRADKNNHSRNNGQSVRCVSVE